MVGVTHSEASAQALREEGIEAVAGDVAEPAFVATLPAADVVVMTASSGRGGVDAYRRVYVEAGRRLLDTQRGARFVFAGSTSVYPQTDGSWVDETSPAEPERETGRLLREAEAQILDAGGTVLRLAGLYGPRRSVLLQNFLLGQSAIDVPPDQREAAPDGRWINQLHGDDAAAALFHVVAGDLRGIFNVADGTPLTQREIYRELARRFDRPPPPERAPDAARKRGWTHKRVGVAKLLATGWRPRYPSWWHALDGDAELAPSILRLVGDQSDMSDSSTQA